MPIHDFKCPKCDFFAEDVVFFEAKAPQCPECGVPMGVFYQKPPIVRGDIPEYTCPVTGKLISGRKAHEENLKAQGCRVLETGETEAVSRKRAEEEKVLDRALEETIGRELSTYSPQKLEKLAVELAHGATTTVERL